MTDELVTRDENVGALTVSTPQMELVKRTIAKDCTDDELGLFLHYCNGKGVHPLDQLIIPTIFSKNDAEKRKLTFISTVDYWRSEAENSGQYDGQDEPTFEGLTELPAGDTTIKVPNIARVNIYKKGIDRPFVGVARWKEYCPTGNKGFKWRDMPHVMLAKCAEVNGMRKAFPKRFRGMYIPEEMEHIEVTVSDATPESTVKPPKAATKKYGLGDKKTNSSGESPKDELKRLLMAYSGGDLDAFQLALKEASLYQKDGKDIYMRNIDGASDKWLVRVLTKFKKKLTDLGCTTEPTTCSKAAWEDTKALCVSDEGSEACRFQQAEA